MLNHSFRLLALALLVGCTKANSDTPAPQPVAVAADSGAAHDMSKMSMPGMDMPVTIPKGALYTAADIHFMQGMIAHHGQAIYMSKLAATRTMDGHLSKLAVKIDQSQRSEIKLMRDWLIANNQVAPDSNAFRTMMMPGMLTDAQLKELESKKGPAFDKAYLTYMIQHHEGALKMVDDLLKAPGAAQDVDVSVFANDVTTVQTAEIGLMQRMLANL